jgi:hypothetical protein
MSDAFLRTEVSNLQKLKGYYSHGGVHTAELGKERYEQDFRIIDQTIRKILN